jgi:site-specific DNA-methyltransferase (adenine-specific)
MSWGATRIDGNALSGHNDTGGASRFFYCAKPSTAEREAGCEALPKRAAAELVDREEGSAGMGPRAGAGRTSAGRANVHPTVKSIDLMRWLLRVVTPRGGVVLDMFAGSGTTGCAAVLEQCRFIGVELDPENAGHVAIAQARIAYWDGDREAVQAPLFAVNGGRP